MHLVLSYLLAAMAIVGNLLPQWSDGCLDIHAINSARGECSFFIFPDGTSMVVDAGEFVDYVPRKYHNFKLMAYAASGKVWDGREIVDTYKGKPFRENGGSCCFLLSYGNFDYYSGGDAGGNTRVALPVAKSIGRRIEAMKADHHLSVNTMKEETMTILRPDVIVTQSFYRRSEQPHIPTIGRLLGMKPCPQLFFTNISTDIAAANPDIYGKAAGMNGHVVIRVLPGGKKYYVFVLDDSDFSYNVKSVHGPFRCHR